MPKTFRSLYKVGLKAHSHTLKSGIEIHHTPNFNSFDSKVKKHALVLISDKNS